MNGIDRKKRRPGAGRPSKQARYLAAIEYVIRNAGQRAMYLNGRLYNPFTNCYVTAYRLTEAFTFYRLRPDCPDFHDLSVRTFRDYAVKYLAQ